MTCRRFLRVCTAVRVVLNGVEHRSANRRLDHILNEHHNEDNFENDDPLPVEAADPPVEDVEHSEQSPDPEVHLQIFPVKPL